MSDDIVAELDSWLDDDGYGRWPMLKRARAEIVALRAMIGHGGALFTADYVAKARAEALEEAARLHEQINPASDDERIKGDPGAGAMGAVIEYRDAIRALKDKPS